MALAGWNTQQMTAGLPAILDLAAASGEDLGTTSDIVTDALSAFGMEAEDASSFADLLASASANSNTNVSMLGDSFKYVAPVMGALGASADDTAMALGLMANAGIKGSQSGTQLRTIMSNMIKPTNKMATAMERYGVEIVENADGSVNLKGTMDNLRSSLGGLDETQQAAAASTIFGKEAMSGALAIVNASDEEYAQLSKSTSDYDGAAKKMAETMQDNLAGAATKLKSALEEAGISLAQSLIPIMQDGVSIVQNLTDKFNELDDGTKDTIVKFGLLAAAVGPTIFVIGKVASVIGTVSGAIAVVSTGAAAATPLVGGLAAAIGFITSPAGLAVIAIGGIVYAGKKLYDHLNKDSIPEIDRFGDKVSENTQEAVGAFMDMTEESSIHLKGLAWSQEETTDEMVVDMKEKQEEISRTLITAIDERHEAEKKELLKHFEEVDILDKDQKQRLLDNLDAKYTTEKENAERQQEKINKIIEESHETHGRITHEAAQKIDAINTGREKRAVKVMSESQMEQEVILEKMKLNSGTITAEEAAEVVRNSYKKKEGVVKEANEQFDKTVAWAIHQRDETGELSDEEARAVIEEAERKRKDVVTEAEDMHDKVIREAKAQSKEHIDEVDWETGEILTKWNKFTVGMQGVWDDQIKGARDFWRDFKKGVSDLNTSVGTSMNNMRNNVRNAGVSMETSFSNSWNNMVGHVESGINAIVRGLNWLLDKLGSSKTMGTITLKRREVPGIGFNQMGVPDDMIYAKGTLGHPGGPAMVNDQAGPLYKEAVISPDGKVTIPKGRNVIYPNMAAGTQVIPAKQTKQMFKYAKGTGVLANIWSGVKNFGSKVGSGISSVWDYATSPSKIVNKIIDNIGLTKGMTGYSIDVMSGLSRLAKKEMVGWAKKQFTKYEENDPAYQGFDEESGQVLKGGVGFRGFRKTSGFGYRGHPIFGGRRFHSGVDLAAPTGTPVYSQAGGMVTHAGWGGGFGNLVKVRSGAIERLYAHLSSMAVRRGANVSAGRLLGRVGSTGNSTGPHLHYEVRRNGRAIHPGYKDGGIIRKEHLARVGEGDKAEVIIPVTDKKRGIPLLLSAMDMMGLSSKVQSSSTGRSNNASSGDFKMIDEKQLGNTIVEGLVKAGITKDISINIDGKEIVRATAGAMDNKLRDNQRETDIGKGVLV